MNEMIDRLIMACPALLGLFNVGFNIFVCNFIGDRLYFLRKEGERGLACIEDSVDASIQQLEDCIQKHDGGLITAIRNDTDNTMDNRMTITRKQKWEGKQLYGRFKRRINNISQNLDMAKKRKL